MIKLYKKEEDRTLYWETWERDGTHTIHWGELGTNGQSKEIRSSIFRDASKKVQADILKMRDQGFREIPLSDHDVLVIEFKIDGWGTSEDLKRRHKLEDDMNEFLGWAGLGLCDGGSIGSGTMEVQCLVVDFSLAEKILHRELPKSPYADFNRIYRE